LKTTRIILWGLIVLALVGIVVAKVMLPRQASPASAKPQAAQKQLFKTPVLTLTDQEGKPFSTSQLHGRVWVADFIFTSCAGSCPVMSHEMAELQKKTPADLHLVSFTVDPQTDTAAILKEYGQGLHADFARWHFLTGTEKQMADAAYGMKISVQPANGEFALTHSEKFLLVDRSGYVVGIYDGTNHDDVARLAADATRLVSPSTEKAS
jgi:cytochrome oxidase Cu insertion factor (SCO1/SenC/PrrC family)